MCELRTLVDEGKMNPVRFIRKARFRSGGVTGMSDVHSGNPNVPEALKFVMQAPRDLPTTKPLFIA